MIKSFDKVKAKKLLNDLADELDNLKDLSKQIEAARIVRTLFNIIDTEQDDYPKKASSYPSYNSWTTSSSRNYVEDSYGGCGSSGGGSRGC